MSIRDLESTNIARFLRANNHLLGGRTLDFGCGWFPYRDIVTDAGGDYWGIDSAKNPGSVVPNGPEGHAYHADWDPWSDLEGWDAIICTQVVQYVPDVADLLRVMRLVLAGTWVPRHRRKDDPPRTGGWLLLTGPLNWPHVESADLHRFTVDGIRELLEVAEFTEIEVSYRASVKFENEDWPLGWAAKARA